MDKIFDTTIYELAHGKLPSGIGSWTFLDARDMKDIRDAAWSPMMSFDDAKKWAATQPRFEKTLRIYVGS